jgi:hypothetical protein
VVSFNFNNSGKDWNASFEKDWILVKPFIVYNNVKTDLSALPSPIFSSLNFSQSITSNKGNYKFGFNSSKVLGLGNVGFTISSNQPLTLIDGNNLFFKFGKLGVSFADLLETYNLSYSVIGKNSVEVRTISLPISSIGSTMSFDPQIVQGAYIQLREILTCNDTAPPDPLHICGYKCDARNKQCYQLSTTSSRQQITRRTTTTWQDIPLPSTAIIDKVEVRQYTITNSLPSNQYIQFRDGLPNVDCGTEYDYMNTSTLYIEKLNNYFTAAAYYAYVDLGANAVSKLSSHKTYFYLGERLKQEPGYANEAWNGSIEWQIASAANPPQLRITYHVPVATTDDFEEGLIKHENWWPLIILACGSGIVFVFLFKYR